MPVVAVNLEPTDTVPEMDGVTVFVGLSVGVAVTAVEDSPAVAVSLRVVRARMRTW